jgi:hypothetical protein
MMARMGNSDDITGVLALQEANLWRNLTPLERQRGFVTTPFTTSQLETIIAERGMFVIAVDEQIVAYAFAGSWAYFQQWEIFQVMTARLPQLSFQGQPVTVANSFQYGPVCVAEAYRGQGLLPLIFESLRREWQQQYPVALTFINAVNTISTQAHVRKLGWEVIDHFDFNGNNYLGLAYDMKKPAG